jgi:hypothetical protein
MVSKTPKQYASLVMTGRGLEPWLRQDISTEIAAAIREAVDAEREACARALENMIIGGRAWTHDSKTEDKS